MTDRRSEFRLDLTNLATITNYYVYFLYIYIYIYLDLLARLASSAVHVRVSYLAVVGVVIEGLQISAQREYVALRAQVFGALLHHGQ